MTLADLKPEFVNGANGQVGVGILFNCPCGDDSEEHQVYVDFANPLDGGPPFDTGAPAWHRVGETFETLSLSPSIQRTSGCRWHGFVTGGQVLSA